jgi:1,4-dihydroxy-2-naphthoate octaprenyltransferase
MIVSSLKAFFPLILTKQEVILMFNKMSQYQFATRLVLIIAIFVFCGEALIMILMQFLPSYSPLLPAFIDAASLIIILSPALYFGLFRSLVQIIDQLRQVEKELRKHRDHLEDLVKERTNEISMLLEADVPE